MAWVPCFEMSRAGSAAAFEIVQGLRVSDGNLKQPAARSVLQRLAEGDTRAFNQVVDQFGGLIWTLARRMFRDPFEVEDAVQDVFMELWKSASRFDPNIASETTFIAMIARRRLIDRLRSRPKSGREEPLTEDASKPLATAPPESSAFLEEDAKRAMAALAQLRPEQQEVLRLSVLHGLTHEQISEMTGLPLGTVKTHARRGLIRIRKELDSELLESPGGAVAS